MNKFSETLKSSRKKSGLSVKETVAALKEFGIEISEKTLYGWENGTRTPDADVFIKLCEIYNLDSFEAFRGNKQSFTSKEIEHIKKYRVLDKHGKEMVDVVLRKEYDRMVDEEYSRELVPVTNLSGFRVSEQPAAAGFGIYLGPESFHEVKVRSEALPHKASFGVPVRGDSMEPKYHDSDILIISTDKPERGEVGLYTMDGHGYVKVLGNGELLSLNPAYKPIPMTEGIICNGKVIGVLDKDAIIEQ